jgi:hypothetical protein
MIHKELKKQKKEHENINDIMERKAEASQKRYDGVAQARANEKWRHEWSDDWYRKLESKYAALQHDMEVLTMKMEEQKAFEEDAFDIRHTEQR